MDQNVAVLTVKEQEPFYLEEVHMVLDEEVTTGLFSNPWNKVTSS
jgi:hypothetical protein